MEPRRRHQRGALRQEGRQWVLTLRGEPDAQRGARPSVRLRVGLRSELRTRQAARAEADRLLAATGASTRPIGARLTFGRYAAEYFARYVDGLVRPQTAAMFRSRLNAHLLPRLRSAWLDDFTPRSVQDYIGELGRSGLAPATTRGIVALLRMMLKRAQAEGLACRAIPVGTLRYPRRARVEVHARCFSQAEVAAILEHSTGRHRLLYAIMAHAGLRVGEALGLEWQHVDIERRVLRIRQSSTRGRLHATKTQGSAVDVPMTEALAREFLAQAPDRGLLFRHANGSPWQADHLRRNHLGPLLERLQLPHGGMHAFRHGLATRLFAQGVGAPTVQAILRHSSLRQTMQYAHTSQALMREALDRAGSQFSPAAARVCGGSDGDGAGFPGLSN